MNFLAHALLSPDDDAVLTGNVCADFIKGVALADLPAGIARGIALHRAIDFHTDRHPAFVAARAIVSPGRRRYAPVLLDIFFDHCLARNWHAFHDTPLERFAEMVCSALETRIDGLPLRDGERLRRMVESRWLDVYATDAGLRRVLAGLNRRARFSDALAGAHVDLEAHYEDMQSKLATLIDHLRGELGDRLAPQGAIAAS